MTLADALAEAALVLYRHMLVIGPVDAGSGKAEVCAR